MEKVINAGAIYFFFSSSLRSRLLQCAQQWWSYNFVSCLGGCVCDRTTTMQCAAPVQPPGCKIQLRKGLLETYGPSYKNIGKKRGSFFFFFSCCCVCVKKKVSEISDVNGFLSLFLSFFLSGGGIGLLCLLFLFCFVSFIAQPFSPRVHRPQLLLPRGLHHKKP